MIAWAAAEGAHALQGRWRFSPLFQVSRILPYPCKYFNRIAMTSPSAPQVDEKVRQAMFKLRQTWNELFPSQRLYVLDYKVNQVDPAWPITAPAPSPDAATSIHVNPRFIKVGCFTVSGCSHFIVGHYVQQGLLQHYLINYGNFNFQHLY